MCYLLERREGNSLKQHPHVSSWCQPLRAASRGGPPLQVRLLGLRGQVSLTQGQLPAGARIEHWLSRPPKLVFCPLYQSGKH